MNQIPPFRFSWSSICFSFYLVFPSLGIVQKYLGNLGVTFYVTLAVTVILLSYRYFLAWFVSVLSQKQAMALSLATFLLLVLIFIIIYPIANTATLGRGSDTDEGFNLAVTELLHARNPYYLRTYLGNPLVQLPGSIFLAVPFVLIGNSAYQNFFWLSAFFFLLKMNSNDWKLPLLVMWAVLVLCPVLLHQVVTGCDYAANTIYVLIFIWMLVRSAGRKETDVWKKVAAAVLLGVGLSCRLNFLVLLPLVFSALVQNAGWKEASKYTGLAVFTFCAVTFPFYFWDPQAFVPFAIQYERLGRFRKVLPFAGIVIPLAAFAIVLILSRQRMERDCQVLFKNCALIQGFFVLSRILLPSIKWGRLDLMGSSYGLFALFFAVAQNLDAFP